MGVTEFAALIWLVTREVQILAHSSYFRPLFKQPNVVFESETGSGLRGINAK